MQEDILWLPVI